MSRTTTAVMCAMILALSACDNNQPTNDAGRDSGGDPCLASGVVVDADITSDTQWSCPLYVLNRKVFVVNDSTLTIAAGTTILGEVGGAEVAALIVTRGSHLIARGTAAAPIVFTSGNPVGSRLTGDWSGVVLMGSAKTNDGACANDPDASTPECEEPGFLEDRIEGIDVGDDRGLYGGLDDAGSCGELTYVRIEFAGEELSPMNELNGLSIGGCGSATVLNHIHVHRGADDGIELFGGTASLDHIVLSGMVDDALDFDEGWRGNAQFVIIHMAPGSGDQGIEADNLGGSELAEPRTNPTLFNFTMVGTSTTNAMMLREGMLGTLRNFVVVDYSNPPNLAQMEDHLSTEWGTTLSIENTFFFGVGDFPDESAADDDLGFDEEAAITGEVTNHFNDVDPMLGATEFGAPNYVPANTALNGQATPAFNETAPEGFGDAAATYAGAIEPNGTDWTAGWTAYPAN